MLSIGVFKERIFNVGQIFERCQRPLILTRLSYSQLDCFPFLELVPKSQIHREDTQYHDLDTIIDHDGNDPRGITRCLGRLERKWPNDVAHAVRDEEDGVDGGAFSRTGCPIIAT